MKRILLSVVVLGIALAIAAPGASAQTTTNVENGTVVNVGENMIIIKDSKTGAMKEYDVASDFSATVDGKPMGLKDLKPGMKITAAIKTVNVPVAVQTTELKNAKVIKNAGALLYVRESDGIHTYNVPAGFRFDIGGAKLRLEDLQVGQVLNATIVHTARGTKTEQEVASASASDEAAKAAAAKAAADKAAAEKAAADKAARDKAAADAAAAKAAADAKAKADAEAAAAKAAADAAAAQQAMAKSLPKTASQVPAAGALGLVCVALGAALTLRRKLR